MTVGLSVLRLTRQATVCVAHACFRVPCIVRPSLGRQVKQEAKPDLYGCVTWLNFMNFMNLSQTGLYNTGVLRIPSQRGLCIEFSVG